MIEDLINEIQDSIGELHDEIEAKRKEFNDALDANQSPEEHGKELANMREEMKRLLDKHYRAMSMLAERL